MLMDVIKLNIDFLCMFITVVELASISKAAEELNISQSALSQRIKVLEKQYGASLLERSYKGVIPTTVGHIVYQHSKNIRATHEQLLEAIVKSKMGYQSIHILATPTIYSCVLPCALYDIKTNYPSYDLKVETLPSKPLEDKISQGIADIGFIAGKPKNKQLNAKKIFSDKILFMASSTKKLPKKILLKELYHQPLIMLSKEQKTRQILDRHLEKNNINTDDLHILYTLDSIESIKLSVLNGYGLAFLPYMAIKKELYYKQLQIIEISDFNLENHYYSIQKQTSKDFEIAKILRYIEKNIIDIIC